MNKALERILVLLAASGLTGKEIRESLDELRKMGFSELPDIVYEIRRATSEAFDGKRLQFRERELEHEVRRATRASTSPADQIDFLLRRDAGLTVMAAASLLTERLSKRKDWPNRIPIEPPAQKETLRRWLQKLAKIVPYNILLQEATIIRNEYVHSPQSDWPLKYR